MNPGGLFLSRNKPPLETQTQDSKVTEVSNQVEPVPTWALFPLRKQTSDAYSNAVLTSALSYSKVRTITLLDLNMHERIK